MANPIQQGLKRAYRFAEWEKMKKAAMANPIQQGLKPKRNPRPELSRNQPQWLIQYNKD